MSCLDVVANCRFRKPSQKDSHCLPQCDRGHSVRDFFLSLSLSHRNGPGERGERERVGEGGVGGWRVRGEERERGRERGGEGERENEGGGHAIGVFHYKHMWCLYRLGWRPGLGISENCA